MSAAEQEIIRLAKQGLPPRVIAVRVQRSPATVSHYLSQARKRGEVIPKCVGGTPHGAVISLPPETVSGLRLHARVRGLTPAQLAIEIVNACARHRIVDAVLDDAERDA